MTESAGQRRLTPRLMAEIRAAVEFAEQPPGASTVIGVIEPGVGEPFFIVLALLLAGLCFWWVRHRLA